MEFATYIIQCKNNNEKYKYHMGYGEMTDRLSESEFYADEKLAKNELSKFDEPENYEIRELSIHMELKEN